MEFDLHVMSAFDTLAHPTVDEATLLKELTRRELREPDARLALDKAVMQGLLVRSASGVYAKPSADATETATANEVHSSQASGPLGRGYGHPD